jgi:4-hydroxy-3-methylbut-2-enyl diphosphate reductase
MSQEPPNIVLAEHAGYCFGVKRTLEMAENALRNAGGRNVYACGPLIHNEAVMRDLARQGLIFIENLDEAESGGALIVRSHGEAESFYGRAEARDLEIIDATCPFVKRIHCLVREAHSLGKTVVIVGDAKHPEVTGINGWCGGEAVIVNNAEEASRVTGNSVFAVAQTTTAQSDFETVTARLSCQGRIVDVRDTICDATRKRQEACRKIAEKADAMLVIGGKNSANTQKLFEIARTSCRNSHFIENISDLPLKALRKCNTIGVAAGASTPDRMIKEVIANMTVNTVNTETAEITMADFMDEIEKSLRLPRNGEIVTGTVIQVSNRDVIINLGCKKDGVIPKDEISLEPEQTLPDLFKEGDEVQAKVLKTDDGDGNILLSKKKVVINEHWEDINRALEDKSTLDVKVVKEVNGGVIAVFKEIYGFIPLSQLSDRFVEKADEFIGKVLTVRVTRVDQRRNKVVFSRKSVLAEARQKRLQEIWESINVGDVIEGTVMRFTDYGAFVDIGGVDGLLHISEISWGKLKHPQEVLKIGETIPVKILSIIREKEKISLGYKQNRPEPWSIIDEKYYVGQVIQGRAVQIKDYGVFVELEPGLDGLVHISEIAFKRVNNISDELSVGQQVSAKILEIDRNRKRISLSIKETLDKESDTDEQDAPTDDFDTVFNSDEPGDEIPAEEIAVEAEAEPEQDEEVAVESETVEAEAADEQPAETEPEAPAEEVVAEPETEQSAESVEAEAEPERDEEVAVESETVEAEAEPEQDEEAAAAVESETVENEETKPAEEEITNE